MGVPEDEINEALGLDDNDEDDEFEIWPDNVHALNCFLAVCRLWRVGPMGGVLGLDYPGVEAVLRMRKIKLDAALLDDLAVMEDGAMEVLNAS